MKKILITGGTGFVGGHLFAALKKVTSTSTSEIHLTSLHGQEVEGAIVDALDLTDKKAVEELFQKVLPDEIYHLASLASVPDSFKDPHGVVDNNFKLTLNVLEAMRQFTPQAKMLLVSSADIYQQRPDLKKINEEVLVAPANPYSASKAAQDILAGAYSKSFALNIVRARPFNHIGAGQNRGFVIADFASQIAAAEKDDQINSFAVGNLSAARDFTAVEDIVQAYILLMEQGQSGEIYNLGRGQAITIQAVLDRLLALAQKKLTITIDKSKFRPVDNPYICADTSKITTLGWQAKISLDQSLTAILQDWREKTAVEDDIIKKNKQ